MDSSEQLSFVAGHKSVSASVAWPSLEVCWCVLQVLGHSVRVKTQEVQGYQLQGSEPHVGTAGYQLFPYINIMEQLVI